MNTKLTRPSPWRITPNLAVILTLAAWGWLILSGCKSQQGQQVQQSKPADSGPAAGSCCGSPPTDAAAKSPKELALAGFLQSMKLQGKPVLIEFGMVGCELSGQGLDNMIALQKANTVSGLAFVRVEGLQDGNAVDKYYQDKAPPFAVYRDGQSALAKALSATAFPTFLLADKFGHIRYEGKYPAENLVPWGKQLAAETNNPGSNVRAFGAKEIDVAKLLAATLPDVKGSTKPLGEYMGSGGLVLVFVDTSCPFSAVALKDMPMVSKAIAPQKVSVVAVNNDEAKDRVQAFYAQTDPGVPVVYDTGAGTREQWNVQSVPIAVYITPDKKIRYRGEAIWANMGTAIDSSLGLAPGTTKFAAAGTGFG